MNQKLLHQIHEIHQLQMINGLDHSHGQEEEEDRDQDQDPDPDPDQDFVHGQVQGIVDHELNVNIDMKMIDIIEMIM